MSSPSWANPSPGMVPATNMMMNETVTSPTSGGATQDPNDVLLQPYSTLDEPVIETIMRDVRAVGSKLRVVMLPLDRNAPFGYTGVAQDNEQLGENQKIVIDRLKDWDLWGPLLVCLSLSVILSMKAPKNQASVVFAAVFVVVWVGSVVVTINAQLLGGTISFFQSLCVLGYCVFPMTVVAAIIGIFAALSINFTWLDLLFLFLGFLWATRASSVFIGQYIKKERRFLAVYPVFFFYIFLGWIILLF